MDSTKSMAAIHDRTLRLVSKFVDETNVKNFINDIVVTILIDEENSLTSNRQVMAATSINLIARFCDEIHIICPEQVARNIQMPFGNENSLYSSLVAMAKVINPAITITTNSDISNKLLSLVIGNSQLELKPTVRIDSSGWVAYVNQECGVKRRAENPFGAMIAACLGAAEIFRNSVRLIGSKKGVFTGKEPSYCFSGLTYGIEAEGNDLSVPSSVDIGPILLVGAGAVGNGLMYALSNIPDLSGTIDVVDYDNLDLTNLNRHLLASIDNVGNSKAQIIKANMTHVSLLAINDLKDKYQSLDQSIRSNIDIAVSTVDNDDTRRDIQSDLPRIVLHGATNDLKLVISRHNFLDAACLGCLFPKQLKTYEEVVASETGLSVEVVAELLQTGLPFTAEHLDIIQKHAGVEIEILKPALGKPFKEVYVKQICGRLKVKIAEQEFAATVSFVSALTGILLAAELLKEKVSALNKYCIDNYLHLSTLAIPNRFLEHRQKYANCSCGCSNLYMVERYNEKHGAS